MNPGYLHLARGEGDCLLELAVSLAGSMPGWESLRWFLEPQKSEESLLPAFHLNQGRIGQRTSIERFFGRVFLFFGLQRPPFSGWFAIVTQVALTYTASIIVALAAWYEDRPDLIRSPKWVLAHLWENSEL